MLPGQGLADELDVPQGLEETHDRANKLCTVIHNEDTQDGMLPVPKAKFQTTKLLGKL
jgi:hypothetical protein